MTITTRDLKSELSTAQREAVEYSGGPLLVLSGAGSGKCLGKDTPVLKYDGTVVPVQSIKPGDQLMGPDSRPRQVLSTCQGYGPLYQIVPVKGDPWVCNDAHVMTLAGTNRKKGQIIDIPLQDYLTSTRSTLAGRIDKSWKLLRIGVDFPEQPRLHFDPYILGLWIGNGNTKDTMIWTEEPEVLAYLDAAGPVSGSVVVVQGGRGDTLKRVSYRSEQNVLEESNTHPNQVRRFLMSECCYHEGRKRIPPSYLTASRAERLQLLAGILDTDGYLERGSFEVVCKHRSLADQILFLCRSLGFAAYVSPKPVQLEGWIEAKTYWRIGLSGDFSVVPCRVSRRQASTRAQIKRVNVTGWSAESIGEGMYYGFELDGDGRFLLGDFTVTHNTRTLTYRAAHLVRRGIPSRSILVTTFTNRATNEFRHRLEGLLGSTAYDLHTGTLHSSGSRILRQFGQLGGFDPSFTIYDVRDSYRLLHKSAELLEIDKERLAMSVVYEAITRFKEQLKTPKQAKQEAEFSANPMDREIASIYELYQHLLSEKNAMDFGDLVMNCVALLERAPDVAKRLNYQELLVDEFQDTDPAQFRMISLLLSPEKNITAVGDVDQCLPPDTLISTPTGPKPIAEIQAGDIVYGTRGEAKSFPGKVSHVKKGYFRGAIWEVRAGQTVLRGTPHHLVFARLEANEELHYVYLMYRADKGYRIGICKGGRRYTSGGKLQPGYLVRMNQEHGDKLWVLATMPSREMAVYYEALLSARYGLPQMVFHAKGREMQISDELIGQLYTALDTRSGAERLMRVLCLHPGIPHHRAQNYDTRHSVNLTMYSGGCRYSRDIGHRIEWVSKDGTMADGCRALGLSVRSSKKSGERLGIMRGSYVEALDLSNRICSATGAEINRRALIGGQRYQVMPLSHVHPGMVVLVEQQGQLVEAPVDEVRQEDYQGEVYDLEVERTHSYIANEVLVHNSIYGFRGADHRIMLGFYDHFPNGKVISLGQNYRSTRLIVASAACVISQNKNRIPHELWSEREMGEQLFTARLSDEIDEGVKIAREIQHLRKTQGLDYRDFAIIYRVNSQSASLEEQLMHAKIPYHVVGQPFFDRREIRDIMLWLKAVATPEDGTSLEELLNRPSRRISNASIGILTEQRRTKGQNLWEVLKEIEWTQIKPKEKQALIMLRAHILNLRGQADRLILPELAKLAITFTGLREHYEKHESTAKTKQGVSALDNLERFIQILQDHFSGPAMEAIPELLEYATTMSQDGDINDQDAVQLMTIHAAKGSEFAVVFVAGCEERLLPHYRALNDPENRDDEIEGERRLFYVALTRAKDRLYLSWCAQRRIGENKDRIRCAYSRFLDDIPAEYTQRWEMRE